MVLNRIGPCGKLGQFRIRTAHRAPTMKNGPNGMYVRRAIRRVASSSTMTTPDSARAKTTLPTAKRKVALVLKDVAR